MTTEIGELDSSFSLLLLDASPVLEWLFRGHHVLVQTSHRHHEGGGELVTPGGAGASRVVALQHCHELPALVLDEVPVLPPDGVDLEHVAHPVPGLLDLWQPI